MEIFIQALSLMTRGALIAGRGGSGKEPKSENAKPEIANETEHMSQNTFRKKFKRQRKHLRKRNPEIRFSAWIEERTLT